ncbi:hypothetical protein FKP32DRAFT_423337 [Trametes sanguinea]|nr:hypothetical protein FKP32DRAFT_423337 [Trametes sanguinea]
MECTTLRNRSRQWHAAIRGHGAGLLHVIFCAVTDSAASSIRVVGSAVAQAWFIRKVSRYGSLLPSWASVEASLSKVATLAQSAIVCKPCSYNCASSLSSNIGGVSAYNKGKIAAVPSPSRLTPLLV